MCTTLANRFSFRRFILIASIGLVWVAACAPAFLIAQGLDLSFERLLLPNGQAANQVNAIQQDAIGYLWFGSEHGAHRFDGVEFTTFVPALNDQRSICGRVINTMALTRGGVFWLGTNGGLSRYHPETEDFTSYFHDPNDESSLSNNYIGYITEDSLGFLWIGTLNGLNRFDPETGKVKRFFANPDDPNSLYSPVVTYVYIDKAGTMWVACSEVYLGREIGFGGLHRYQPEEENFIRYRARSGDSTALQHNDVWVLLEDRRGNFWVGTHGDGLHLMDREKGTFTHYSCFKELPVGPRPPFLESQRNSRDFGVRRIFEDPEGRLWILGIVTGLSVWDPESQELQQFSTENSNLPDDILWDITQARDGSLWLNSGTGYAGVSRIDQSLPAVSMGKLPIPSKGQTPNELYSMLVDSSGRFWVGGNPGGVLGFRPGDSGLVHFRRDPEVETSLSDNDIHALAIGGKGIVWAGGWHGGGGLNRIDVEKGQVQQFLMDNVSEHSPGAVGIPALFRDSKNNLWVGTYGRGLQRFDRKTENFQAYLPIPGDTSSLLGASVLDLAEGEDGHLWVLGIQIAADKLKPFLQSLDPQTGHFTTHWIKNDLISFEGNTTLSASANPVGSFWSLQKDQAGHWWFVNGPGLVRYDPESKVLKEYPALIEGKIVKWLQVSAAGYIYLAIEDHMYRFDPENEQLVQLPLFLDNHLGHFVLAPQGEMPRMRSAEGKEVWPIAWGGQYFLFQPDLWDSYQPKGRVTLHLSEFSSSGKTEPGIEQKDLNQLKSLSLKINDLPLSIRAQAFNYQETGSNHIRYRLLPFDKNWEEIRSGQRIHLSEIPAGTYQLEIQTRLPFGYWSTSRNIAVLLSPPWYETVWGKFLLALAVLGLLFGLFYLRLRNQSQKLQRQAQALEKERELNNRLRNIDKLKDQFLANTSHELRTPLNGIIGLSEALMDQEDEAEKRENLEMIVSSGKRLSSLVNDILDFSKLKTHEISLSLKAVHFRSVVKSVLHIHQPMVLGKEVELVNAVPEDLPSLWVDEDRLQQILFNLVGNAVKFTERGQVLVGVEEGTNPDESREEKSLTLFVKDTGIGIPEAKRELIFQEFEQGDGSISRQFAGTGLGLTISKQLVELHGGHMWVDSEPGKGSTFFFSLPITKREPIPSDPSSSGTKPLPVPDKQMFTQASDKPSPLIASLGASLGGAHIHVLVVDDEPINQQVIKNHLRPPLFQLSQAMNGEEALELLHHHHFDLVLLDVMMPRMSGYEVCEKIRERFLPSELPVIMITAKNQIADLVESLQTGANDYIAKPFSKDEFLARIETHLNLHRINTVTNRFVPIEFIRSLGKKTLTEVYRGDQVELVVSVLFSDIRNYTGLAETMKPDENFRFVNAYAGRMGPIIKEHHGFVNQYLGDGIMAIFQQSPEHALKAAIGMQEKIRAYNEQRKRQNRRVLAVGMGLHTGPLIMGIIGDAQRTDAATISDAVNTASRMEGLTKHYGLRILLSEVSVAGMKNPDEFHLRYLGKVKVKGKRQPLGVYECFDGDPADQVEKKLATQEAFKKGLDAYFAKEFAQAALHLKTVLDQNPEDTAAQRFYRKSGQYINGEVPEGWTGMESMDS